MVAKRDGWMTVEDFLALDRENLDQKYEFRNGQMVAMAGGSTNHGILINNVHGLLYPHLRKSPCIAFVEGTLKVEDECYLPDIMVTCNEQDLTENKTYIEYPKLVVEVLSPTTENNDRRDKLWVYTQCFSIQEYILVNWDCMVIQKMTRKGTQDLDRYQWIDQAVLWSRADTTEALISGFAKFAELLQLPQKHEKDQIIVVEAVKEWLKTHDRWLLILDNADELAVVGMDQSRGHQDLMMQTSSILNMDLRLFLKWRILSWDHHKVSLCRPDAIW